MPFTTLCPFDNAAIQLTAGRAVRRFARAHRLPSTPVVTCTLGLLLFAPVATFALELGEASIKSGLGQSLRVEIPYRLAANERLTPACVGLVPAARSADVLPTYTRVSRISVSATHIEIYDDKSVREPLIGLNVDVHCSTAPRFVRSYQLFVDPPARMPTILSNGTEVVAAARKQSAIDAAAPVAARPPNATAEIPNATPTAAATIRPTASAPITATPRANPSPRARGHAGGNLTQGQTYRVVRGDTLSGIAARISERPATIRQTADAVFAANSEAFTRGNRDLIEEGRSITIPILTPASATLPVLPAPAPLAAIREAELPTAAPLPAVDLAPALVSATPPPRAGDAASVVAPVAIEPLPAAADVVEPSAAPVPAATSTNLASEEPSPATAARTSAWLVALLVLGVVILVSAPLVFVRRRKLQAAARARGQVQTSRPRRSIDPVAGIEVVEGRLARASSDDKTTVSISSSKSEPAADSAAVLPAGLGDLAVTVGPTDSVDLDVGAPVMMNEGVDWFADRADAAAISDADDETIEENVATALMPDLNSAVAVRGQPPQSKRGLSNRAMDDDQMTMTIVELDMLRQDYEAEHTLTHQASQALRDAVADLKATQAAHAATAETSTLELPKQSQAETADSAGDSTTARVRMK